MAARFHRQRLRRGRLPDRVRQAAAVRRRLGRRVLLGERLRDGQGGDERSTASGGRPFIADEAPDLHYATAPLPVPGRSGRRLRLGPVGGTVIGIPKGSPHPDEAWLLVKYMATDTATLVYMANNVRKRADDARLARLARTWTSSPQFQTFLDIFKNPDSQLQAAVRRSGRPTRTSWTAFADKWQAGKETDLEAGLQSATEQIDDQLAHRRRVGGRTWRRPRPDERGGTVRRGRRVARRPRRARAQARPHRCCCSCRPGSSGSSLFTLYPMVASLYFSFTNYSLLDHPRWIGTENYTFMFTKDPFFWLAFRNTIWIILVGVPLRIIVRDPDRVAARAASVGVAARTGRCSSCRRWRRPSRRARVRASCSTRRSGRSTRS